VLCGPSTGFSTIQALLAHFFKLQREPQERWAAFSQDEQNLLQKQCGSGKKPRHTPERPRMCRPSRSLGWDLALTGGTGSTSLQHRPFLIPDVLRELESQATCKQRKEQQVPEAGRFPRPGAKGYPALPATSYKVQLCF